MLNKLLGNAVRRVGGATLLLVAGLSCRASSTSRPTFLNPASLGTPRGYSNVVEVPPGSRLVYVAGQVATDSTGRVVGAGDFHAQAVQVFENLKRALGAAGASFNDVVKLNFYVVDASQVSVLRDVRDRYVNTATPPASTLVEIRRLVREEYLLEVEAVAVATTR